MYRLVYSLAWTRASQKNLSISNKKPLNVDLTVYLWEIDCRFKSCSFDCLASPQSFMLIKVSRYLKPVAGTVKVAGVLCTCAEK